MSANPKLKAIVVESGTIPGEFSLRAIKDAKQVPFQMVIKDSGFVPGDIVEVSLHENAPEIDVSLEQQLRGTIEDLERENRQLEYVIDRARRELDC